jgi:hypothetical protein
VENARTIHVAGFTARARPEAGGRFELKPMSAGSR